MSDHLDLPEISTQHLLGRLEQLEEATAQRLSDLADSLAAHDRDSSSGASPLLWLLVGAAVGAATTLLLDPEEGQRRRQELTDRARSTVTDTRDRAEGQIDHATNLAQGAAAQAVDAVTGEDEPVDAHQLRQRVRSEALGSVEGADGIAVLVHPDDQVELRGHVDSDDTRDRVLQQVREVDGVDRIIADELTVTG